MAGLRLRWSLDRGATWREVSDLRPVAAGEYQAAVRYPPIEGGSAAVSLRVEAWDADGNRTIQTITDAYALTGQGLGG